MAENYASPFSPFGEPPSPLPPSLPLVNDTEPCYSNFHYDSLSSGASNNNESMYNYNFISGPVSTFEYNDPIALNLIKQQVPVIMRGSNLVASALKWDLHYLSQHLGSGEFAVFIRNAATSAEPLHVFKSTMDRREMSFDEFLRRFHGDRQQERVYLQQPLNTTVGPQIAADFVQFNWSWAAEHKKEFNWGPLTSNLLLIGQKGNITPCHFDEQQNLFCPLQGRKKILLFHPENYPNLYPYPVHHPNDRQSQVDLDNPDLQRFPKFAKARAVEAVVGPGDILYIPMYWWHHVINLDDTIAINFWHKAGGANPIEYPLQARQKISMVRNIEKMLLEAVQDQNDLKDLLHWIVDGRF